MIRDDDPDLLEFRRQARLDDDLIWDERDRRVGRERAEVAAAERAQRTRARIDTMRVGLFPNEPLDGAVRVPQIETPALRYARAFLQTPSTFLILVGATGTGKTTAATAAVLQSVDAAPGFLRAAELERRGRYDKQLGTWLSERTSLVLDDLGVEVLDSKGVFRSWLDEIVDDFYARHRLLIITANLDANDFAERYGDRTISRFAQRGTWASCGAHDLRRDLTSPNGGQR